MDELKKSIVPCRVWRLISIPIGLYVLQVDPILFILYPLPHRPSITATRHDYIQPLIAYHIFIFNLTASLQIARHLAFASRTRGHVFLLLLRPYYFCKHRRDDTMRMNRNVTSPPSDNADNAVDLLHSGLQSSESKC